MSALPENIVAGGGSGPPPVAWWRASSPVGGDVVLSGVVLLFVALAFAFVLHHYFTVTVVSRSAGTRDGGAAAAPSTAQQRGTARDATRGLDPSVLRALPVTVYKAKDDDRAAGEAAAPECAVCLAELADGEAARFLPRCGHGFHAECIDLWLRGHATCPLCRVDVDVDLLTALPSATALPPALPEPANYPTNLPTNVLFWGSQDAVTVATASGTSTATVHGGPSDAPAVAASPPLVIHVVRETAAAATPSEGDAAKAQGLARLSALRRLWSRGTHDGCGGYCTHAAMATNQLV